MISLSHKKQLIIIAWVITIIAAVIITYNVAAKDSMAATSVTMTKTKTVVDSSKVQALRDSIAMLRATTTAVKIRRVIVRDTITGRTTITLDSSAAVTDTIRITQITHDTLWLHESAAATVSDSQAIITRAKKKKGVQLALEAYTDRTLDPGIKASANIPLLGPIYGMGYIDYQDDKIAREGLEIGAGAGIKWHIFRASAVVKNYQLKRDFDFKIRGGVEFNF